MRRINTARGGREHEIARRTNILTATRTQISTLSLTFLNGLSLKFRKAQHREHKDARRTTEKSALRFPSSISVHLVEPQCSLWLFSAFSVLNSGKRNTEDTEKPEWAELVAALPHAKWQECRHALSICGVGWAKPGGQFALLEANDNQGQHPPDR